MKTLRIIAAVLVAVLTLSVSAQAQTKKKAKTTQEVTFSVLIDCESCKQKLDAALPYIKGVKAFKINMDKQTVWFKYDPEKVNNQKLNSELTALGYPGKIVTEEAAK